MFVQDKSIRILLISINGYSMGTLPYSRRLEILNLTTLAERRIRGDLIEAFKVINGLTDYGSDLFRPSRSGLNLVSSNRCSKSVTKVKNLQCSFLPERVVPYWNKLPSEVKNCLTVLSFNPMSWGVIRNQRPKIHRFRLVSTVGGPFRRISNNDCRVI